MGANDDFLDPSGAEAGLDFLKERCADTLSSVGSPNPKELDDSFAFSDTAEAESN